MDATLPFLILYACLSALLFFWDAKHGLLPDRFRAHYSGQVLCSIKFVILTI